MFTFVRSWNMRLSLYILCCLAIARFDWWPGLYGVLFWIAVCTALVSGFFALILFLGWVHEGASLQEKAKWGVRTGMSFVAPPISSMFLRGDLSVMPVMLCMVGAGISVCSMVMGSRFYGNTPLLIISSVLAHVPFLGLFTRRMVL